MNAAELRIGNYYESVKFKVPVKCEASDIVQIYHNADGAEVDEDYIVMVFEPIPLTEEWAMRFGIKEGGQCTNIYSVFKISKCGSGEGYNVHVGNSFVSITTQEVKVHLKYVHQLQNLYFAITGKELDIKDVANENPLD